MNIFRILRSRRVPTAAYLVLAAATVVVASPGVDDALILGLRARFSF